MVNADQAQLSSEAPAVTRRWPVQRIAAWALIAGGVLSFLIAGDVRTNWVIGDTAPDGDSVALPRLATIALLLGLTLLASHQLRARRPLSDARYRGPSVLVLLALIAGLSVLFVLPVRNSINLALDGGDPGLPSVLIWTLSAPTAMIVVTWLVLRARPMPGLRLLADARPIRHVAIGIGVGVGTQVVLLGIGAVLVLAADDAPLFQVSTSPLPGILLPGQPLWLGAVSALVLAPVSEELFFRGLALHAWLREYGRWVALIGSSALFGLVHYGLNPLEGFAADLPWLALPTLSGVVLGVLALRTRSLIAPIAAHATMNAVALLLALSLVGPTGPGPAL